MDTYELLFSIGNMLALVGWLGLLLLPRWHRYVVPVTGLVIPGLLAVAYIALVVSNWGDGGFGSLAEVRQLFALDALLLAGWLHYLAFDLLIGTWEAKEARRLGISHWLMVPCLLLTFMFGPAGWLLFMVVRGRALLIQSQEVAV